MADGRAEDGDSLREPLLALIHGRIHIGEVAVLRQVMGTWPPDPKA